MSSLTKYLVIVGVLIAIGAMLLIVGSQTITGDLVIEEGKINNLTQLEISKNLIQMLILKEYMQYKQLKEKNMILQQL